MRIVHENSQFYLTGTPSDLLGFAENLTRAVNRTISNNNMVSSFSMAVIGKDKQPQEYPAALNVAVVPNKEGA